MNPQKPTDHHTPNPGSPFMLFFRGHDWDEGMSREETQRVLDRLTAWIEGLQQAGVMRGGSPLARAGSVVSERQVRAVADGPFAEAKEIIGGYLAVEVADLAAAVAIARKCPTLGHGITIEVRPVLAECPIVQRLREQPALAAA